jgi:hypothetical protein
MKKESEMTHAEVQVEQNKGIEAAQRNYWRPHSSKVAETAFNAEKARIKSER